MTIQNFQCARFLLYPVLFRAHYGWAGKKFFKLKVLRWPENAMLNLVFANRRANLLIFLRRSYRKYVRYYFVGRVYYGPAMAGLGEIFQNEGSQMAGKRYLRLVFANTVNASFNYMFFQLLYKHYVAINSSEIT